MSDSQVIERLQAFERQAPEIVFEWNDASTGARGWAVLNSLRGGRQEVEPECAKGWTDVK